MSLWLAILSKLARKLKRFVRRFDGVVVIYHNQSGFVVRQHGQDLLDLASLDNMGKQLFARNSPSAISNTLTQRDQSQQDAVRDCPLLFIFKFLFVSVLGAPA